MKNCKQSFRTLGAIQALTVNGSVLRTDIVSLATEARSSLSDAVLASHVTPVDISPAWRTSSVDLSKVRSVWHPTYAGSSWGELLGIDGSPPRLRNVGAHLRELEENPQYYLRRDEKEDWSCYEVGGWYHMGAGYHRTVVGRYFLELNCLPPIVHGIAVASVSRKVWLAAQRANLTRELNAGNPDGGSDFDSEAAE